MESVILVYVRWFVRSVSASAEMVVRTCAQALIWLFNNDVIIPLLREVFFFLNLVRHCCRDSLLLADIVLCFPQDPPPYMMMKNGLFFERLDLSVWRCRLVPFRGDVCTTLCPPT